MLISSSQIKFNEGEKYAARNPRHRYLVYWTGICNVQGIPFIGKMLFIQQYC